uniref:OCA domain-containing protein n=1 Tax=Latimeria chalumnae TaxID=7897 RepID=H3BHW9_LATCH
QKRYLGVRVRLPVRDLLRNIRIAKGINPSDLQSVNLCKMSLRGEKKRVHPYADKRSRQNKQNDEKLPKSLEDLEMLVEVLKEDLQKTCQEYSPIQSLYSPSDCCQDSYPLSPESPEYYLPSESPEYYSPSESPEYYFPHEYESLFQLREVSSGYQSNTTEKPSMYHLHVSYSSDSDFQVPSPHKAIFYNSQPCNGLELMPNSLDSQRGFKCVSSPSPQQDTSAISFFQFQLQREESMLKDIPNQKLLAADRNGNMLIHKAVIQGKRALAYVLARRMVALQRIDAKDASERTALHLSAEKNQHLMVSDLISLGAQLNEKDSLGKTPLHLCAENGYVPVLEVLKSTMEDGVSVEIEALDHNGLTPLHCAVLAHCATVKEFEKPDQTSDVKKFLTLRKEQLLDGIICLQQMGANPFTTEPI